MPAAPLDSPRCAWLVVAAAFALMFVGFGAAYSFAAFFTSFEAEFGALRGEIALVFSLCAFLWFSSGAPAGMLADRFGARRVAIAGVRVPGAGALAGEHGAVPWDALCHLQHRHRYRRGPGVRAFGRRGATPGRRAWRW